MWNILVLRIMTNKNHHLTYSLVTMHILLMKHGQTPLCWFCQHMYLYFIADIRHTCELPFVRNIQRYIECLFSGCKIGS